MNEPLFRSAYDALVFAFNYSSQQYGKSPMIKTTGMPMSAGKGLSGVDGAAQAGFIRAEVAELGKIPEAILTARFAPHTVPCGCRRPCCVGKQPNKEWTAAIKILEQFLESDLLKSHCTTWDMRTQYVMRQFLSKTERIGLDEIAKRNDRHINTVSEHNSIVKLFFFGKKNSVGAEEKARNEIEKRMIEIGMVQIDNAA